MQHVSCTDYVVIGQLLHKELQDNQKIHRSILAGNEQGKIVIYYYKDTFILECDTNGDNEPNDYYFFKSVEEEVLYKILSTMGNLIGTTDERHIRDMVSSTLRFLTLF